MKICKGLTNREGHWVHSVRPSLEWPKKEKRKISGFWSRSPSKSVTRFLFCFGHFFCQQRNTWYIVYVVKLWWPREASRIGQTFIPLCGKAQHGRIPIDLAIVAHCFIAKRKLKTPTHGSEAKRVDTRNRRLFWPQSVYTHVVWIITLVLTDPIPQIQFLFQFLLYLNFKRCALE